MAELAQQREQLHESLERDEQELREAVEDLKEAVNRPFRLLERIKQNPLPWMMSGLLLGLWLGTRNGDRGET